MEGGGEGAGGGAGDDSSSKGGIATKIADTALLNPSSRRDTQRHRRRSTAAPMKAVGPTGKDHEGRHHVTGTRIETDGDGDEDGNRDGGAAGETPNSTSSAGVENWMRWLNDTPNSVESGAGVGDWFGGIDTLEGFR